MLKISENCEDNGLVFRAVVDGLYTETLIAHANKDDVDDITTLFEVIRNMGETEFKDTISMIKKTATYY